MQIINKILKEPLVHFLIFGAILFLLMNPNNAKESIAEQNIKEQIIYQWFNTGSNWPRGSAYAVSLLVICVILVLLMMKIFKVKFGEIGRCVRLPF